MKTTEENPLEGIAIIGMSGRFPGAGSVEELWANLRNGIESIRFFTDAELAAAGLNGAELRSRGSYVPARGFLKDADCFDAAFFGIHPKEAEVLDPQHRIFLETCWSALEHAGYAPGRELGLTGVFAGATYGTYFPRVLQRRPDLIELVGADLVMFSNEKDYIATRVAYKLGLNGPALSISTACSTSLVAIAQACQSLLTYQCDVALAGAASVNVPQESGYYHDDGNIGSADGHTRTFDAAASGTVFSNGAAVVVLKRLEDAVRDGDHLWAVIKGAAVNNDGSQRVSFGAPGVEGQAEVVSTAHALAGFEPETITYVEAHGTATPLGDPIEVAALTKAFRLGTDEKQFCGLGSLKSNIGHLDAASGVAGLIKVACALKEGVLPASLNFVKPNPKLDLENSPFYVNTELRAWQPPAGIPRRAGVSSFGTGGTNAHLVLEQPPEAPPSSASRSWQMLMLSAKTPAALDRAKAKLADSLAKLGSDARSLADLAYTLQAGRRAFDHRLTLICRDAADAVAALNSGDTKRVFTGQSNPNGARVVFMFPGQGAQYPGMAADLYRTETVFRAEVDRCAEVLKLELGVDLREIIFSTKGSDDEATETLKQTRFTQPALFVIEYALARLWMSWGIEPAAMIGHSVGEYVAACLAGVFSLEDALFLVARRAALVQDLAGGAMLAIRQAEEKVLPLLSADLSVAAVNSPHLCVVAGPHNSIALLERELACREIVARHLYTSHAFHSAMMDPVVKPFQEVVAKIALHPPRIPYVSGVTGKWITDSEATSAEYWAGHVRQTVRFAEGVAQFFSDPSYVLIEVGPGKTLATLAWQHTGKKQEQTVLASLPSKGEEELQGFFETMGRLWVSGAEIDWQKFYAGERRYRVPAPTYAFERQRYWPDLPEKTLAPAEPVHRQTAASVTTNAAPVQTVALEKTLAARAPRKKLIEEAVRALLSDVSGYDLSEVAASADVLELGLDSLLLTQASQLIQRRFGAPITFRMLMEDLCSIEAIATYLDEKLPMDRFAEEPAASVAEMTTPAVNAPAVQVGALPGVLEQLLRQQQELTQRILETIGSVSATSQPVRSLPALPKLEQASHGPFKRLDRSSGDLSAEQRAFIDAFVDRYVQRTGGSKKLAANNRPILADPRSVAGFKQIWKEMIYPIYTNRSEGSRLWDVDGNEYIDFVMAFGGSMFGHRPPFLTKALHDQLDRGFETGPIHPMAGEVAALIQEFSGMERVAFTNTGSEAVLAATRVARTVTGRDKIVVFAGAYHGIFDEVLFRPHQKNGVAGAATIAPGIPESSVDQVIVLDYGNPDALQVIEARASEIAAVLVEPVQSRRLDLRPREFLHQLRDITRKHDLALIFDEVVTGFRIHPGGAQAYFGVRADLATYGKVLGAGYPVGVVAGAAKYLDALDGGSWKYNDASFPEVGVTFFAGTFVRHPLALAAAKAVLTHLKEQGPDLQRTLDERAARTARRIQELIERFQAPYSLTQFSSLMTLTFPQEMKFGALLHALLRYRGIHIWENRNFIITTAHSEQDLDRLVASFDESFAEMQAAGFLAKQPDSATGSLSAKAEESTLLKNEAEFPLTESQKEIWLAAQMSVEAAVAYNESISMEFRGEFDIAAFRTAIHIVLDRHPILLASIDADGQCQRVHRRDDVDVPVIDLSDQDEASRKRQIEVMVEAEARRSFDLSQGPLARLTIVKLSERHNRVIWTAHHIVCDGWSIGVVIHDLAATYSSLRTGRSSNLAMPVTFQSYAAELERSEAEAASALAYWRKQLADAPLQLNLPAEKPRPAVRTARATTLIQDWDAALYPSIKRAAAKERTTLVVILLTALKALLFRLSGQTDTVVGLTLAGQGLKGKDCLVGHCVNLVPIRTVVDPAASFRENLAATKRAVLDAYDHPSTIGTILKEIRVPRSADRPPLVEIIFNVDRSTQSARFEGLEFMIHRNPKRALYYDFFFNFVEESDGLRLECDYNSDLYDDATVGRWMGYYQAIVRSIVEDPSKAVGVLPIYSEQETALVLARGNGTEVPVPSGRIEHWFQAQAAKAPASTAVSFGQQRLSYQELDQRSNQVARYLRSRGVGPDVLVGILLERSLNMVIAMLGVMKAGGAYVPLDPSLPPDRLSYMVSDSGMTALITQASLSKLIQPLPSHVVSMDTNRGEIEAMDSSALDVPEVTGEHLAYVRYTSGSTGKPKGVEISRSASANFLSSMQREPGLSSKDILLAVTTLSFDISELEILLPLVSGGQVVIASSLDAHDPGKLMELLNQNACTVMQATPATWRGLLHAGWEGIPGLKILCGGEALPADLAKELLPRCSELWNMYGPTETTVWSTVHRVTDAEPTSIPIGHPIANTQVYILDRWRNPVAEGAIGELYIGGDGLARGYRGRPELSAESFVVHPATKRRIYRTGDYARRRNDGNLECLGRVDNQVKIRGFRIELGEIEAALRQYEGLRECVVVAREDHPGEKRLVAYLEADVASALSAKNLRAFLSARLPEYMIPSVFVTLDRLPLNASGKIDRKALPAADPQASDPQESSEPWDPFHQSIAAIWRKVLRVDHVGLRDSFFDLGGHSLAAVRMLSELRKLTGKELPLATLFQTQTIEGLADLLRQEGWVPSWSSLVPIRGGGSSPPLILVHGAEGNILLYQSLIEAMKHDRPIYGFQSHGLDGKSPPDGTVADMARRYVDELRTVHPNGPYYLGGYCLGGMIALEMAQQLRDSGAEVRCVFLIDTYNGSLVDLRKMRLLRPWHLLQNLWFHFGNYTTLKGRQRKAFLSRKFAIESVRARIRLEALMSSSKNSEISQRHLAVTKANDSAADVYVPAPYSGSIVLLRSKGSFSGLKLNDYGWAKVATGELEVRELDVYQRGILVEPFSRPLARTIDECMEIRDQRPSPPADGADLEIIPAV